MGVVNSGREALIVQYSCIKYIRHNLELENTANKLCKTRTFISKELHWNSYTFICTVLTDSLNQ